MKKENKSSTVPDAKPMLPAVPSSVVYNEDCVEALKHKYCDYVEVSFGGDDEHERIVRSKDTDLDAEDGL